MAARRQISDGPDNPTARVLAVFALALAAVVVLIVIAGSVGGDSDSPAAGDGTRARRTTAHRPVDRYYVIQEGDTFNAIAEAEGITPLQLQELNPDVDPQELPVTGCLDLVPDGCKALSQGQ